MTYRKFVIVSYLRSGTHLLRTALESHPAIVCQTEVFNSDNPRLPYPLDTPTDTVLAHWVYKEFPAKVRCAGFVLQAYHPFALRAFPGIRANPVWEDIWSLLAQMPQLAVVHLRRENLLSRHLSHLQARRSGQWHAWDPQRVAAVSHLDNQAMRQAGTAVQRDRSLHLDAERLITDFEEVEGWHKRAQELLSHHPNLELTYEQLCNDFAGVSARLLDFLQMPRRALQAAVKKLERRRLPEAISNYTLLKQQFADTRWQTFFSE